MKTNDIKQLEVDFTKVVTYKILITIKNCYGSLESFKQACNSKEDHALFKFNKLFHIDSKILQALTRTRDGKRNLDKVLSMLNPKELVYKHKCDVKYKSGKKFKKPSTFYIPFERLNKLFELEDDEEYSPFISSSKFYTKEQYKIIDKYIYKFSKKQRKEYTKTERFNKAIEARTAKKIVDKAAENPDSLTDDEMSKLLENIEL